MVLDQEIKNKLHNEVFPPSSIAGSHVGESMSGEDALGGTGDVFEWASGSHRVKQTCF